MSKEYKALFYFMNEEVSLVEVEHNNILQWLRINPDKSFEKLTYKSSDTQVVNGNEINIRVFEEAELRFDNDFGKFQHGERGHIVMKQSPSLLPADVKDSIQSYLGQL